MDQDVVCLDVLVSNSAFVHVSKSSGETAERLLQHIRHDIDTLRVKLRLLLIVYEFFEVAIEIVFVGNRGEQDGQSHFCGVCCKDFDHVVVFKRSNNLELILEDFFYSCSVPSLGNEDLPCIYVSGVDVFDFFHSAAAADTQCPQVLVRQPGFFDIHMVARSADG